MVAKNNPGEYDCYESADPDEPMFVLLARDAFAPLLVRQWADSLAFFKGDPKDPKVLEARTCADAMEKWNEENH